MAIPTHKDRVGMSVSSVAGGGTGAFTLNAALSGFRSFATAYGADATLDYLAKEGTAWEVAHSATYTHSGTTLSRGTLVASSTGAAVSFTSAAEVYVTASAHRGNQWQQAPLEHVTGTDADTTMAVGYMYVVDMSAWATADCTYTLPAAAAVGDRVGIMVTSGNASFELIIKPNTGDTINGGSAAAEWSRLFITGEVVILRCVTADSAWVVEVDGRIPCRFYVTSNAAATANTGGTLYALTGATTPGSWNTPSYNIGNTFSTSTSRMTARRANGWVMSGIMKPNANVSDANYCSLKLAESGGQQVFAQLYAAVAASTLYVVGAGTMSIAAGAYVEWQFRTQETDKGAGGSGGCQFAGYEVMQ